MTITKHRRQLIQSIKKTAECYQHSANAVRVLAVSKGQPIAAIEALFKAGIHDFGESYLQEAQQKIRALSQYPICWHFIGPIQSNKTKGIAEQFNWVHSVSQTKIATLLNQYRPAHLPALNLCLQVNLDHEQTKSGVNRSQIEKLALFVDQLPKLKLRGLMAIPLPQHEEQLQYESFLRFNLLREQLNNSLHLSMDTLSMGMSNDWVAAIRAGSTMLRIGRAFFTI